MDIKIREKMYTMHITNIRWDEVEEMMLIPESEYRKLKLQLQKNTFIDLWDRVIPRKRIADVKPEKWKDDIYAFLATLWEDARSEAKKIITERQNKKLKINWVDHLKMILEDRWFM